MAAAQPPVEPESRRPSIAQLDTRLRRYCRSLTKSRWDAEDLAQEAWIKALRANTFHEHPNQEALLVRIAKTTWIDRLRRRAAEERLLPSAPSRDGMTHPAAPAPDPGEALAVQETFRLLGERLSPRQRTVVILRDVLGFSGRETAALLGTSEGAVKAALHRARRALEAGRSDARGGAHQEEMPKKPAPANRNQPEDGRGPAQLHAEPATPPVAAPDLDLTLADAYLQGDVVRIVRTLVPDAGTLVPAGAPPALLAAPARSAGRRITARLCRKSTPLGRKARRIRNPVLGLPAPRAGRTGSKSLAAVPQAA